MTTVTAKTYIPLGLAAVVSLAVGGFLFWQYRQFVDSQSAAQTVFLAAVNDVREDGQKQFMSLTLDIRDVKTRLDVADAIATKFVPMEVLSSFALELKSRNPSIDVPDPAKLLNQSK